MSLIRTLTQQLPNWLPTLAAYGGVAGGAIVYFTEWRVITDYIPLYNQKYSE